MSCIAIVGDDTTTSALALASGWCVASESEVIVVEADPRGGSVAAWLDVPVEPSLSGVVSALHRANGEVVSDPAQWAMVEPMVRRTPAGPRIVPAPFRSREARTAVAEAGRTLLPLLARLDHVVALVDGGLVSATDRPEAVRHADTTVIVHRQATASAGAEAVRLERLAELVATLTDQGRDLHLVVVGDVPFGSDEIAGHVAVDAAAVTSLPVDPLAAAVLAGHRGVSARRLRRLPLMRAGARLAARLDDHVARRRAQSRDALHAGARAAAIRRIHTEHEQGDAVDDPSPPVPSMEGGAAR